MFEHSHKIRVRYAETDQMGIVHHSRYALYIEEARTESMRAIGIPYNELEKEGIILPLMSMQNRFIAPALYDDILVVKTIIKEIPQVKFSIDYEIYKEEKTNKCIKYNFGFCKQSDNETNEMPKSTFRKI